MPKQDKEKVRRLLEDALEKLDGESPGSVGTSNSILFSESDDAGTPVIMVLIGGLNSSAENGAATLMRSVDRTKATAKPSASGQEEAHATHPGLERFALAVSDSRPAAPKACFIEPGRACVSSGACEMRGF